MLMSKTLLILASFRARKEEANISISTIKFKKATDKIKRKIREIGELMRQMPANSWALNIT